MNDLEPRTGMREAMEMLGFKYMGIHAPHMTNLNNSIPADLEETLRGDQLIASHTASNFHGYVWFNGKDFSEEIWRWNRPVKVIRAGTLREIMDAANAEFGAE